MKQLRLDSRTSHYCHEYLHKKNAANRFDLSNLAEDDEIAKERKRMGDLHEARVIASLKSSNLTFVQIDQDWASEDQQVATAKALLSSATQLIFGATIGAVREEELRKHLGEICKGDQDRISKPDILVRTSEIDLRPLWSPVDIKSH